MMNSAAKRRLDHLEVERQQAINDMKAAINEALERLNVAGWPEATPFKPGTFKRKIVWQHLWTSEESVHYFIGSDGKIYHQWFMRVGAGMAYPTRSVNEEKLDDATARALTVQLNRLH